MKTTFLGQGFESSSVNAIGNYLVKYLNQQDFHSFTGISAFASEAGIFGLSGHIETAKKFYKNLSIIVGIDQEGTSKEALYEILKLNINSYIFYQNEAPIFHPKIYLFEGNQDIKLIIGSSNLTGRGLFRNVESSLLLEFDINDPEGTTLLATIKTYYKALFDFSDPNLFKICLAVIDDFTAIGIVPDEIERKKIYSNKKMAATTSATPNTNALSIPKRNTAKIPANFPTKPRVALTRTVSIQPSSVGPHVAIIPSPHIVIQPRILVWQKPKLSQSDAQRVPSGTAVTANLKLTQAGFKDSNGIIDQTIYFRNELFNNLPWGHPRANDNTYEEVFCSFDINILGNPVGLHNLKLSHKPSRVSGQGNVPTWLHWGNTVKPFLQQFNITGKTVSLFKSGQSFSIEIK